MADLRDEFGNPIHLTDVHGNPVQLKDEYGHPMHLTGISVAQEKSTHGHDTIDSGVGVYGLDQNVMSGPGLGQNVMSDPDLDQNLMSGPGLDQSLMSGPGYGVMSGPGYGVMSGAPGVYGSGDGGTEHAEYQYGGVQPEKKSVMEKIKGKLLCRHNQH